MTSLYIGLWLIREKVLNGRESRLVPKCGVRGGGGGGGGGGGCKTMVGKDR